MILRTIKCDICGAETTEVAENVGFPGWGGLNGIQFDGQPNPNLCPGHLAKVADYMDQLAEEARDGLD